ncbi:uncharacterized protein Z519_05335 [Cladophialophora bantiana CBS 173.52]|uniref:Ketoreductase (KR) domain-containing protein n=1 Tax=Cladophialophora bantiana (strain ATCC 10958 / CBS 173.52 / CDC B-1940 / NIH 8579) TaxID=1442370 RepID=A0A0D2IB49_CLAB1|nr:uncharacterized protein Z519_05335 [Cladophialophora bantiana CBS 173.52]KIW94019.1 hypothetical protein Z519_05335 [Cladophialophora bantiana CBS 173.52]
MVSLADIQLNNTSLLTPGSGPVCALVGCTSGIGLATLHATLRYTSSPTVFLVGRGGSARLEALVAEVQGWNASAHLVPVVAEDLTLVACAQHAAAVIASKASRLDLLIMSPGYLSLSAAPDVSPEGLDRVTSIRYHARMRILLTLLPLLRAAPSPRVLSVLAGGREGALNLVDLGMTLPGTYGPFYAAGAAAAMTTLFFEHLSKRPGNERIVFLHICPGVVYGTGLNFQKSNSPGSIHTVVSLLWDWVFKPVFRALGYSPAEAGERVLFAATNGRFRRVQGDPERARGTLIQEGSDGLLGSGVHLVKADSSVVEGGGNRELMRLRNEMDGARKVWEYTIAEFERIERM